MAVRESNTDTRPRVELVVGARELAWCASGLGAQPAIERQQGDSNSWYAHGGFSVHARRELALRESGWESRRILPEHEPSKAMP